MLPDIEYPFSYTLPLTVSEFNSYRTFFVCFAGSRIIVLQCYAKHGISVVKQAHEMGMMGPGWVWIGTDGITGSVSIIYDICYLNDLLAVSLFKSL